MSAPLLPEPSKAVSRKPSRKYLITALVLVGGFYCFGWLVIVITALSGNTFNNSPGHPLILGVTPFIVILLFGFTFVFALCPIVFSLMAYLPTRRSPNGILYLMLVLLSLADLAIAVWALLHLLPNTGFSTWRASLT